MMLRDVTQKRLLGLMVLLALVPLEVGAAALSHETLGWVEYAFYCLALLLNLPLLALVLWRPLLGSVAALVLFLVLVMTNERFSELFGGPPRRPETEIGRREMDLARSIQEVTEEAVLALATHARQATGKRHLCMAGGVALNCVANGKLLRSGLFDDLWIQPAAGDRRTRARSPGPASSLRPAQARPASW